MSYYLLDDAGYVTGTFDGPGQPASSTSIAPPANATTPLQFVDGAWLTTGTRITYMAFLSRFTASERAMIRALQSKDSNVADIIMLAQAASFIDLTDERVAASLSYFVAVLVLTAERAAEILSAPVAASEMP